jgi:hypothetical protein
MGPCFLGIGATRSGTTFLHARLREHPQIWLPPQKEIHYFNFQRPLGYWNRRHMKHVRRLFPELGEALRGKRGVLGELRWQLRYFLGPRNDSWFLSLLDPPPGLVTGQIEPTYATLPIDTIRVVHDLLPDARLIFMMRDPIERAWSSVTASTARNKNRPMAQVSEDEIFEKIHRSGLAKSTYLEHIERWEQVYPKESFLFGFFDEILEAPALLLDRVRTFIGVEPFEELGASAWDPVNDTRRFKVEIPPHIERHLAQRLIGSTRALEARFGGFTTRWLERMERVLADARPQPGASL